MNTINSNSNTFDTNTTTEEQTMMNTETEQHSTSKPTLIDASLLQHFFVDVTEFLYEKQNSDGGTMTASDIVRHISSDSYDYNQLKAHSDMIDLMIDLGWLDLHAIGTSFDNELLYQFQH